MGISEIIDFSKIGIFVLWVVIPIFIMAKSYLAKKFFSVFEFSYLILSILFITVYEGFAFGAIYLFCFFAYILWWSVQFEKYRQDNPGEYEEYRKFYSEYYGDDLNGDGIKDAFEQWEIAHDPRLFWLFGSKMAKRERRLENERNRFYSRTGFNGENYYKGGYHGDKDKDYSQGAGSSFTKGNTHSSTGRDNTNKTYSGRTNSYNAHNEQEVSDAEREVARQHEFAMKYNLRYFAMCTSKAEAKKVYRKYAAKFHPDNAVTGNKEKFIAVDEEYNRFCAIPEIS